MEVKSIKDFEREPIDELDHVLDSAVDQLVTLTQPEGYWPSLKDLLYRFGAMHLGAERSVQRFEFSLPSTCPEWPGPHFGSSSLHKVIAKPWTKPNAKAKAKAHGSSQLGNGRNVFAPKSRLQSSKTMSSCAMSPQTPMSFESRTPPLRLIDLPPEIRNLVWNLIAARQEPVEAQLRQIQPCKKLTPHRTTFVRRFPQEPPVAMVNKQVRQEVLSIFYAVNRFVFERNNCSMFAQYGMLSVPNMLKWKPQANLASFLTSVDVKFNALPRVLTMVQILFQLRRKPNGATTIEVSVEKGAGKKKRGNEAETYCLCDELDIAAAVMSTTDGERERDLADCAVDLVQKRHDKLFSGITVTGKSGHYFPHRSTCEKCAQPTFERVYSGM
ncbi:hypothetical protein Slin15195_G079290 [Septoria linicola]|uniref:Uncharacterized protein n=1 Tax=Septoria linicola TaxID=215465 RepID=A0A9Q9AY27_9PEZI|nr:hypothetical protein Slin14017_G040490 [Septoria linicola]USW54610.1 hypothetical protein Slin15195_G079290 [Septoria linicola]